ncbi:hypothetical protein ACO2Q9_02805 [Variovorax sp. VNK109]|uniref:hypothetical protein n=1 Tax=Variovorax sp. VNK109 TaxID=3400919 RepID=UPI003C0F3C6D
MTAARLLLIAAAAAGIAFGGYRFGVRTEGNAWRAQQLEVERLANQARVRNEKTAADARVNAAQEKADQEQRYADLNDRFKKLRGKVPLVVAKPSKPADPKPTDDADASQGRVIVFVDPDPSLSNAAVWMWNSALAGRADVPPGACGADGGGGEPDPSCAEGSGLTLGDAWDNHAVNAQICARNAARLTRLIGYLKKVSPQ